MRELGAEAARDYEGREPLLVGALKGCIPFACDLSRVASITVSTGKNLIRYPWLNYKNSAGDMVPSEMEGHPLSHMQQSDPNARSEFVARARWER